MALFLHSSYAHTPDDHCMAIAINKEASKTIYKDQVGVYQVIKNRAKKLSMSVCEVLKQPKQFSFVKPSTKWIANKKQLELLDKIRKERIMFSSKVLYFHRVDKHPKWASRMQHVITIGQHRYYEQKEK